MAKLFSMRTRNACLSICMVEKVYIYIYIHSEINYLRKTEYNINNYIRIYSCANDSEMQG